MRDKEDGEITETEVTEIEETVVIITEEEAEEATTDTEVAVEVIRAEVDMITEEEGVMEVTTVVDTIIEEAVVTGAEVATIRVTEGVTPGVDKEDMDRVAGITKAGVTKAGVISRDRGDRDTVTRVAGVIIIRGTVIKDMEATRATDNKAGVVAEDRVVEVAHGIRGDTVTATTVVDITLMEGDLATKLGYLQYTTVHYKADRKR